MSVWTHQILIYIQKTNFPHSKKAILTQAQLHLTGMSEKYLIILLFHQRQPGNSLPPVSIQSQLGLAPIFLPVRWLSPAHAFQLNQKPAFKDNAKMRNLPQNPGDVLLPSTHTYKQSNKYFCFPIPKLERNISSSAVWFSPKIKTTRRGILPSFHVKSLPVLFSSIFTAVE